MQLIEVSEIGVRASIIKFTSPKSPLSWLVFPMVHLGPPGYYEEVRRRMSACHLVLAEGIDSKIVAALTMAYRAADGSTRLGAIVQPDLGRGGDAGPAILNSDISGEDFNQAWATVPVGLRVGIPLLAPLYGVWLRWFARPEDIHAHLETYDLPSRDQLAAELAWPALFDALIHRRDAHLLQQIDALDREHRQQPWTLGVAYGAAHMPAVVHHLAGRLGYIASSAEWVTVFDYTN
jgi:hypothetical protein